MPVMITSSVSLRTARGARRRWPSGGAFVFDDFVFSRTGIAFNRIAGGDRLSTVYKTLHAFCISVSSVICFTQTKEARWQARLSLKLRASELLETHDRDHHITHRQGSMRGVAEGQRHRNGAARDRRRRILAFETRQLRTAFVERPTAAIGRWCGQGACSEVPDGVAAAV